MGEVVNMLFISFDFISTNLSKLIYFWLIPLNTNAMTEITLPFGKVHIIHNDIAEAIIDDTVIINLEKLRLFHNSLLEHFKDRHFSLLVNKKNSYTYEFEAQLRIASLKHIKKIAIIAYSQNAKLSSQILMGLHKSKNWNAKMFVDREEAIDWLLEDE